MRDADVRQALRSALLALHADDPNTRLVEEMGIWSGSVRVDVAVINGELAGFEIKSAKDTLERLPGQAALYSQVFDRVTLVVAERHAQKGAASVPTWWGIANVAVGDAGILKITEARPSDLNPTVDPVQVARLLWRDEAIDVLSRYSLLKGYKSKTSDVLASRLADVLHLETLRFEVRTALKRRHGWLGKAVGNEGHVAIEADDNPRAPIT